MYHLSGVDRGEATVLLYENRASKIYAAIVDICARMTNTCGTRFCAIKSNIYHSLDHSRQILLTGKTLAREDKTNSFV